MNLLNEGYPFAYRVVDTGGIERIIIIIAVAVAVVVVVVLLLHIRIGIGTVRFGLFRSRRRYPFVATFCAFCVFDDDDYFLLLVASVRAYFASVLCVTVTVW